MHRSVLMAVVLLVLADVGMSSGDYNRNVVDPYLQFQMDNYPNDPHSAIVFFNTNWTGTEADRLRLEVGSYELREQFPTMDALSGTFSTPQLETLSIDPTVRLLYNNTVGYLDNFFTAKKWYGVNKAWSDFGVEGDRDGSVTSYSKNDIVVCHLDVGVNTTHSDLDGGKVIDWKDVYGGSATPLDNSADGHGTAAASIIAGSGDLDSNNKGVAYGAAIVGVKVTSGSGISNIDKALSGYNYCVGNYVVDNIRIISLSLGFYDCTGCQNGTDPLSTQVENAYRDANILTITSGGKHGPAAASVGAPCSALHSVCVCSISDVANHGFHASTFYDHGPTSDGRIKPDICAPGEGIIAANNAGGYSSYTGTSFAAPFVAGVAALALDADPTLSNAGLRDLLTWKTAEDWGESGKDNEYGFGRLQAYSVVKTAGGYSGTGPTVPNHYSKSGSLGGTGNSDWWAFWMNVTTYDVVGTLIDYLSGNGNDFVVSILWWDGSQWVNLAGDAPRRLQWVYHTPGAQGGHTGYFALKVYSNSGGGNYVLDFSYAGTGYGGTSPSLIVDG